MVGLAGALTDVIHDKHDFCRLCYGRISSGAFWMQDAVTVPNRRTTLEVMDILTFLLGEEFMDDFTAVDCICEICLKNAINSYNFISMCKRRATILDDAIEIVTPSLQLDDINENSSLFISLCPVSDSTPVPALEVQPDKISTFSYYIHRKFSTSKSEVLRTFKQLKTLQHLYSKKPHGNRRDDDMYLDDQMGFDENTGKVVYSCQVCDRSFCSKYAAQRHYLNIHLKPETPPLLQLRPLTRQIHDDQDSDNVDEPEIDLKINEDEMYIQLEAQDGITTFNCSYCLQPFFSKSNVQKHYLKVHLNIKKPSVKQSHGSYVCPDCGKVFKFSCALQKHEQTHRPEQCPKCLRFYKTEYCLKNHVCIRGERPKLDKKFECAYCGAKYGQKRTLGVHIKFEHEEEKKHVCQWCDKKFAHPSSLMSHIVKHTKEKKFKCEICDGQFVTRLSLVYHMRLHTGEKPFKCKFCDEHFLSSSRRADHVRLKHMEPSLQCPTCGRLFKDHRRLSKHKKRHENPNSRLYIRE